MSEPSPRLTDTKTALAAVVVVLLIAVTRIPYVSADPNMSRDGMLYISSMPLDHNYCVPMPGNLGYVLLGKAALTIWTHPIHAFIAVNVLLTAVGVVFLWRLGRLFLPEGPAAAAALALACCPTVWWHGATVNSYLVWLAALPAIGFFGVRFARERRSSDALLCSLALGIGTALRQDLLFFGTPLWLGCLVLGRARRREWLIGGVIVAAFCAAWFGGMSAILGGPAEYLARIQAKHAYHMKGFSPGHKGLFEGLVRNLSKYAMFLIWAVPLVLIPFAVGLVEAARRGSTIWRAWLLGLLWVGPSWVFSFLVFAGNAGLIFPFLPIVYLGAAWGLYVAFGGDPVGWVSGVRAAQPTEVQPSEMVGCAARTPLTHPTRKTTRCLLALAAFGVLQFTLTPMLPETNQRNVIFNVTLLRYSGRGLLGHYDRDLEEYGVDPTLRSVLRQMRDPQPLPPPPVPEAK